jgi:hypothetical protein
MSEENKAASGDLVPSGKREPATWSAALVRRGLQDIAHLTVTADRIAHLVDEITHFLRDPQRWAEAAKDIIEVGPFLDLRQDEVGTLFWSLVVFVRTHFESGRDTSRELLGDDYPGKPTEEFRRLAMCAL